MVANKFAGRFDKRPPDAPRSRGSASHEAEGSSAGRTEGGGQSGRH